MGRVYLPQDELARFGVEESDLARGRVNDRFRALMRFQIDRARRYYAGVGGRHPLAGRRLQPPDRPGDGPALRRDSRGDRAAGFRRLPARARVSTPRKLATLAACQVETARDAWRRFWG